LTFDWWPKALTLEGLTALAKNPDVTGGVALGAIATLAESVLGILPSNAWMWGIALIANFAGALFLSHVVNVRLNSYRSHWRRNLSCSFASLSHEQQQYLTGLHRSNRDLDTRDSINEPFMQDLRDKGYVQFTNVDSIDYKYIVAVTHNGQRELEWVALNGGLPELKTLPPSGRVRRR
jgi:hypothetical protein